MRLWTGMGMAAALMTLCACDSAPSAPINAGYCWRLVTTKAGKLDFAPVSIGDKNLETCAAHLEATAMRESKSDLIGAYQGQFIFITPKMVQSGLHLNGVRYRLFDAPTRAKIDRDLRWMLDDEKHPSRFAPGTAPR